MDGIEPTNQPERPIECTDCKRPIAFHYTEIVNGHCSQLGMCQVCPQLQQRLKGSSSPQFFEGIKTDLTCGECGTTLDEIRKGSPLGCSVCYSIFGDVLLQDMIAEKAVSAAIAKKKKQVPLHIGRSTGETQEISPSLQLIALNEALTETLAREDYEQAAWLRDQIKALTDEEETGRP